MLLSFLWVNEANLPKNVAEKIAENLLKKAANIYGEKVQNYEVLDKDNNNKTYELILKISVD